MDCDDVMLLLAQVSRTLTGAEASRLHHHLEDCEACNELAAKPAVPRLFELPVVDPMTFEDSRVVATGGMGKISRAFDRRLGREVAIKEMLAFEHRARFEREAAITARLQHPAVVPIYEAGTWPDGSVFYTMRLVSGGTLADAMARATTLEQRLALLPHVVAVADAIAYAHSRRIVHRDLKPQNVLVGEFGETVVIDWGLAKELDGAELLATTTDATTNPELTKAGTVLGTPCFMPPEQANGEELDERADVFAVGAMLYNLIAGMPPYWDQSKDSNELVDAVRTRPPTSLDELAPQAPADLRAIVAHAMAREPADRYRNAGAMAQELRRFQAGQLLLSREYRIRDLLARWVRRHRAIVTVVALAVLVLTMVAVVAIVKVTRAHEIADTAFERGQRKLCESESPRFASPWDANARGLVHRRFESLKLAYVAQTLQRVDENFDRWSAELAAARESACKPDASRPREQLAAELDCLADRTREARALIAQFQEADAPMVLGAASATDTLAPITRCTPASSQASQSARVMPPDSPALAEVRDRFATCHALMVLGKNRDAIPIAREAVAGADKLGDPSLRAQALVTLGAALAGTSETDAAVANLQAALRLAENAQDDRSRAQAWVNLVQIEYWRGHFDQVLAMQAAALGACERINDLSLQTEIMMNVGGALEQTGKLKEAQAELEQVVDIRRKAFGTRDARLAFALGGLGNAYAMQGNLDAGIATHRDALATTIAALGATHPNVGIAHANLGDDYVYGLRAAEGVAELEQAVQIAEAANGPKHRDVAMALTDLGTARLEAGNLPGAAEAFDRADATWLVVNAKHPSRAEALLGRYLALQGRGKVADLEAALVLAAGLPPFERARIQLALGMAKHDSALVKAAATGFATSTLPLCQRELAAANAWLAANHAN